MHPVTVHLIDPLAPEAVACRAAYFATLNARFPEGFDVAAAPDPDPAAMRAPRGTFLVAYAQAGPLGCVALSGDGGAVAEVKRLWVAPEARGQGLARRLMAEVEAAARALGYQRLCLDTNRVLAEAIALYRSSGWHETSPYNANPYAHRWFAKELSARDTPVPTAQVHHEPRSE